MLNVGLMDNISIENAVRVILNSHNYSIGLDI